MSETNANTLASAFQRLQDKNIDVNSMLSLGAGSGADYKFYRSIWPDMSVFFLDMDSRFESGYQKFQQHDQGLRFEIAAAGGFDGKSEFAKSNDVGGTLIGAGSNSDNIEDANSTPVFTLDTLVNKHQLQPPYFLKFDTHGAEQDILDGAARTLAETTLIQMEMYNFHLSFAGDRCLTFPKMFLLLESLGFRCIDIIDPLYRPGDRALWQFHGILLRQDHPIFRYGGYSSGELAMQEVFGR